MFRALVVDDDDMRHGEFDRLLRGIHVRHARSAPEAIRTLERSPRFDVVFLDFDLDLAPVPDPGTGLDVAEHLARMPERRRPAVAYVHSRTSHPTARHDMARTLRRAGIKTIIRPFHV